MRLAVDHLRVVALPRPDILRGAFKIGEIDDASSLLEGTYIIRLYAEFEAGLRSFWEASRDSEPRMSQLLDLVASGPGIPDDELVNAHRRGPIETTLSTTAIRKRTPSYSQRSEGISACISAISHPPGETDSSADRCVAAGILLQATPSFLRFREVMNGLFRSGGEDASRHSAMSKRASPILEDRAGPPCAGSGCPSYSRWPSES